MANKQTLKNTTDRRVAQMRNELGGSNNLAQTSKFDKKNDKGIPVLNLTEYENLRNNINPIENIFRGSSISGLRSDKDSDYARLQELTPIYNQAEANRTQRQLERIGQTDIGRGTSDGLVNDIRNQGQGNGLERYINTPYSAPNVLKNLFQDNFTDRNGTLTPEMRALGITEESLQNWNNRQNEQERQEVLSQWAKDNPVISSINAVPENAFQSIANTARQVKDYVTGKPLETRETNADIYRSAVNEDIDSKVGQLAYGGANSLADMLFATLLTAPLGGVGGGANAARNVSRAAAAIMGAEKGNQVMNSAIERGLTPNQIMAEGAGSAFSTFATEALPLERILGGSHILSSMLSEGLQEGAEDLVDTAIDELVTRVGGNADKSELHQNYNAYIEAGYDPDEAFKNMLVDYGKQVGIDALLGGITGGLMGGGSNLMSGRNIITGRIPTVAEVQTPEAQTVEAEQIIPEVEPIQNTPEAEPNIEQPSEAVKTPVEDAQTIVDNFLGSLPTLSKEQATQGYRNVLETLTAIGNENPEIRSDLGAIWTDFNNQIKERSAQTSQTIPTIERANPENVVYHAGKFSRLNKAETNGRFAGSNRDTGYFGTGHYFVDNNTVDELNLGGYKEKPLTSVDISGYTNLFRADTDAKARKLHDFLSDMTKYTQGSDRNTLEEVYQEYLDAFKGQNNILSYEEFSNRMNGLTDYMRNSNMDDRGDSVSTQFMKSLGYGGVDTRGTRYADTRYGTVIYDVDENSVLQSNIPTLQRETTDMLTRSENRNVYDAEEDARIQSLIDERARRAEIDTRADELFDSSEIEQNEETLNQLYNNRKEVQDIIGNINSVMNNPEEYVDEMERDYIDLGFDPFTDDERINRINETLTSFGQSLDERTAELDSINNQIAELEARNNELYQEYRKAWEQAEEEVNRSHQESTPVAKLKRTELRQYQRQMEGMNSKLSTFKNKKDANRLTKAYNAIANSEGEAQAKAIEKFNSLMNEINEKMAGETVGITARDNNKELYEDMKRVTDGYKVRVSKDAVKQLGLNNYTELNNATNTRSSNRIKFVEKGGTPIDAVYPEMYDQAHGTLPSPQNMAEGDLLKALYNYITEPKSASGEMAYEESWNDIPADAIYSIDSQIEDITDPIFDKIDDGIATAEDLADAFNKLNEISMTVHDKAISRKCVDAYLELSDLLKEKVMNADVYDPDIEDADYDELNDLADQALEGYNPEDIEEEITFEIPREHNSTAGVNTGRYQQSEAYTNTAENSGMVNDKIRELDEKYGHMMYENNTEAESLAEADRRINENGEEAETKEVFNKDGWTNVDADVAMILYRRAFDYANSLDEQGVDSTEAWGYCYDLLEKIKEEGSRAGQALQAYAKWSRSNTAEGLLAEAMSIIEEAKRGDNIDYSKASAWEREVERETRRAAKKDVFRKNGTDGRVREVNATDIGFMREFLKEAAKLNGLPVNSLEFKRVYDNLGKLINTQIPAHLTEKVRTLLMDNMLGNARTLITRNAGGNIGFNLIEQLLRRPLTAAIDAGLSKARNTRRTTGWSLEGYKDWGKGAKDAFKQEWYDFLHGTHSARSGEVTLANAASQNRRVFKNNKTQKARGLNYLLNKADNLVRYGLSLGDRWAYEASYNQTIAELERLYRDGKMDRTITKDGKTTTFKMPRKEFEQYAQEQAKINGLEACYQDDSEMAQAFLAARRLVNKMSRGLIGTDILSQFTIPFAKTPANIIQRAIEYSPLGLAKNAVQTIREVTNPTIGFDQRRFSVDTSRNIIGSALFALGIGLAKSGAMTGGYSEDKDMRQAQKEAGMQEYALHHPFGLEADVDIGWLPVLGNDMVAAAAAYDAASKPELSLGQSIGQGLTAGLKTQFETSALQGLSRFIGGQGSFGNSNGDVVSNAKDTLMSGMTQFVPSLLRQYANATDPYQRQLSGPNPDDYYFNSVMSAIPGLREKLEPKIGRTGEDLEQNHSQTTAGQWFNNFINPANVTYGTEDPVRDEAMRLYESIGDNRAFEPTVTMSELKVDDHVPTAEEFTEYQRAAYGAMNEAAQELFDTEAYEDMTDEEKVNVLAQLYSSIKTVEKKNILDLDKDNLSGPEKAYDENGVDGLIEYLTVKNYLSQMGLQNNEKNRQVVLDALNEGGTEAVQQMINDSQELSESDVFRYNHATNYIPSLTPSEFSDLWTTINTDGNTSIKQSEVIDYLNQNPEDFDAETALQYWRAFDQKAGHDGEWTKIPVLNPDTGLWEAKKV